jgi:opacity protein-like surface antigen
MNIKKCLKNITMLVSILGMAHADDSGVTYAKEGFYVGTELGGTVVPNVDLGSGFTADFNPGIRFDVPLGYRVNEWFSVEFAPGFMWNQLNSLEYDGASASSTGTLWQVPLLVNFILTIPTDSKWEPFVGGGVGGLYSSFDLNAVEGTDVNLSGTSWALGYSALAGLNYHLSKDISFGFNYKFTGTGNQNWSGDLNGLTTNVYTHSASLSATFRF